MLNVALTSSDNKPKTIIDELKEKFKEDTGNDLTSDTVDTYIKEIYSLLFLGIQLQNLEIVEYLVNDLDANVNLVYRDGRTPLDIAQIKLEDFTEFDYDKTNVKEAENAQAIVDVLLKKEAKHSESYKVEKLCFILEQIKMNQSSPSLNDENHELPSASELLSFDDDDREEKGDDDYSDFNYNDDDNSLYYELIFDNETLYSDLKQKLITEKRAENEDDDREEKGDEGHNENENEPKIEKLLHLLENVKIDLKHKSMGNAFSLFKDSSIEFEGFLINPADRDQVLSQLTNDLDGIDNNKNDDDDDDYSDDFDDDDDDFKNADVLSLL
jgi:hypothetical protein